MATIEDLTVRIEAATVILESDVTDITAFKGSLEGAVTAAETARDDAQGYATQAQSEVDQLLALKPVFKGEYGVTIDKSAPVTLTTAAEFEAAYGQVFKMKLGATGLILNGLPDTLVEGWHVYLFNSTGSVITVSGSQAVAGDFIIPDGHIARVNRSTAPEAFRVYDITTGTTGGILVEATLLSAASVAASQQPTLVNVPLQIECGPAQGTPSDPVSISATGQLTFHQAGQYRINYSSHFGRTGASGVSILFTRLKVNGVIVGSSRFARLSDADQLLPFANRFVFNANAGDVVTFEIVRDSAGANFGGLFQGVPTLAGSPAAPSFSLTVGRLQGNVDPSAGATNFTDLNDVPTSYVGQAGKVPVVNGTENGLVFQALTGAVDSVNGQTGVVVLDAADVGALPTTYIPAWNDISGKPTTFAPSAHVHSAADITSGVLATARLGTGTADATKVLKGDGTWGSAPAPAAVGFPIAETNLLYNGLPFTNWPELNPNQGINLNLVSNVGGTIVGNQFFTGGSANVSLLPCGNYYAPTAMTGLTANAMIQVHQMSTLKRATAFQQGLTSETGKMFVFRTSDSTWLPV